MNQIVGNVSASALPLSTASITSIVQTVQCLLNGPYTPVPVKVNVSVVTSSALHATAAVADSLEAARELKMVSAATKKPLTLLLVYTIEYAYPVLDADKPNQLLVAYFGNLTSRFSSTVSNGWFASTLKYFAAQNEVVALQYTSATTLPNYKSPTVFSDVSTSVPSAAPSVAKSTGGGTSNSNSASDFFSASNAVNVFLIFLAAIIFPMLAWLAYVIIRQRKMYNQQKGMTNLIKAEVVKDLNVVNKFGTQNMHTLDASQDQFVYEINDRGDLFRRKLPPPKLPPPGQLSIVGLSSNDTTVAVAGAGSAAAVAGPVRNATSSKRIALDVGVGASTSGNPSTPVDGKKTPSNQVTQNVDAAINNRPYASDYPDFSPSHDRSQDQWLEKKRRYEDELYRQQLMLARSPGIGIGGYPPVVSPRLPPQPPVGSSKPPTLREIEDEYRRRQYLTMMQIRDRDLRDVHDYNDIRGYDNYSSSSSRDGSRVTAGSPLRPAPPLPGSYQYSAYPNQSYSRAYPPSGSYSASPLLPPANTPLSPTQLRYLDMEAAYRDHQQQHTRPHLASGFTSEVQDNVANVSSSSNNNNGNDNSRLNSSKAIGSHKSASSPAAGIPSTVVTPPTSGKDESSDPSKVKNASGKNPGTPGGKDGDLSDSDSSSGSGSSSDSEDEDEGKQDKQKENGPVKESSKS